MMNDAGNPQVQPKGAARSADYSQTNNCGSSLPANGSCTINVVFTPTTTGTGTGTLTVTDEGPGSPQTASFTGVGVTGGTVTLTPTSLNFGNQTVGVPSSPQPRHPEQQPVRQPDDQQRLLADQQLRQVGTGERELHHQCGLHSNHHRY
ncbi:MAG: choice-of-anchor D domain-containing protein [Acidobacteriota bacterium]|nr:choice-of-anchor D domain-containing protein [Acidobacteriota bacterium]